MDDNEPVNFRDLWGLEAGTAFATLEEAVEDFAKTYNDDSIREGKEFGATVYQDENGEYYYSTPNIGTATQVNMYTDPKKDSDVDAALVHTHGEYLDNAGKTLSTGDRNTSDAFDLPVYAATPGGQIQKHEPNTPVANDTYLPNSQIPSDPKAGSDRKTSVSPYMGAQDDRVGLSPGGTPEPTLDEVNGKRDDRKNRYGKKESNY
ncbi:MAG TPA: DUF4329 domain-containing protein [Treponemataceae bacterium]|nr:DUF4329 domain-containing protein [Treponemataceae bacterium]HQL04600.1 DUF4329 domain-containing protein [Treponemataceae bacterium]